MFSWQLQEALGREPSAARVLVGVYTRDEHWFPTAYRINTARGQAAGNTGWVFSLSTLSILSASIPTAPIPGVYLPTDAEHGQPGHMIQYENPTGTVLEVLWILHFLLPDHAQPGCALGCHYWRISGIQLCLWGTNQAPSAMIYTSISIYSDGECPLSLGRLSTSEKQWMPVLYYFSSPWRLFHHHGPCCLWPWDPATLKTG